MKDQMESGSAEELSGPLPNGPLEVHGHEFNL